MKKALIFGVGGQDGAYLASLLLEKGYKVCGTTRNPDGAGRWRLTTLDIEQRIELDRVEPTDFANVHDVISRIAPDEIYYLSAQSSVARSFEEPGETFLGIALGLLNVIEAAWALAPKARVFNAASGDCFGETWAERPATETTPFAPRSPYAAAKCAAHHLLAAARLSRGQFLCSGFLFNHESALRDERFAIGRIIAAVDRIRKGSPERLILGNIGVERDWGWAPEYVEAMWLMLQQPEPEDFVIATGRSFKLEQFVEAAFAQAGLDWNDHVDAHQAPPRQGDILFQYADPSKAREKLGWSGSVSLLDLPKVLIEKPA